MFSAFRSLVYNPLAMASPFTRTEMLLGSKTLETLSHKRVAVFGVGGVGGNAVEALARCGIGEIDLIDDDVVALSNLNRQIIATLETVGRPKVDVAEERIHALSPTTIVHKHRCFYLPEDHGDIDLSHFDYIVDAIDTVSAKLDIITEAKALGVPVISALGCGNRVDPTKLRVCDISETSGDPLAKILRRELRRRGIRALKVVCSTEPPLKPLGGVEVDGPTDPSKRPRRSTPGSTPFVPPVAGTIIAYVVAMDLSGWNRDSRD